MDNVALVLTDEAESLLSELLDLFKAIEWVSPLPKAPLCLACKHVDFSGNLVCANVLSSNDELPPIKIWIPPSMVRIAIDLSENKSIGFLTDKS